MNISSSQQSSSNQGGTRAASSNEQKGGRNAANADIPQLTRDKDSDDDSVASVNSVHSVQSTESQRRRRMVQAGSPSKRAVEFVTVQGNFAEVIHDLLHIGKVDFLSTIESAPLEDRQDIIFGEWFSKNITLVHQQNLRPGFWIFQFDSTFDDNFYYLYKYMTRVLCVTEASPTSFKVVNILKGEDNFKVEDYVPSDSYFYIAKPTIAVPQLLSSLNLEHIGTTLPPFEYLSIAQAAEEERVKADRVLHKIRISEVATAAMAASDNNRERRLEEARVKAGEENTRTVGASGERGQFHSMALAIQDTGKAEYRVHNLKTFRFLVNIQKGDSLEDRIGNASKVIGNFSSQRISMAEAKRHLEIHFARSNNRQDLMKLAVFDFKLEAFFSGSFGGMNDFKDSKSSIHLKDFVTIGMTRIDTADMTADLSAEVIKTAIFNLVKVVSILSGDNWEQVFKEYTDWATHYSNDEYQQGPAAYAGSLRFYFARCIFAVVMNALAGTLFQPAATLLEVQDMVTRRIRRKFEEYADDINDLKDVMLHNLTMHRRTSTLRLDVSATKPIAEKAGNERKPLADKVVSGGGGAGGRWRGHEGGGRDFNRRDRDHERERRPDRGRDLSRRGSPKRTPSRSRSRSRDRYRRDPKRGSPRGGRPMKEQDAGIQRPCIFEVGHLVLTKGGARCTNGSECKFRHERTIGGYKKFYGGLSKFREEINKFPDIGFNAKVIKAVDALS